MLEEDFSLRSKGQNEINIPAVRSVLFYWLT